MKSWTAVASLGAGTTVIAILAIAVPHSMWAATSVTATAILFLSTLVPVILPVPKRRDAENDATAIFLIGPLASLYISLIVLSVAALSLALVGQQTWSFMTDTLWAGTLIVGYCVLQASTRLVASAASQTVAATQDPRARWASQLRVLSSRTAENDGLRRSLENLADRVSYSANERESQQAAETQSITRLLSQLEPTLGSPDECLKIIKSAEVILEQREQSLRAVRARA